MKRQSLLLTILLVSASSLWGQDFPLKLILVDNGKKSMTFTDKIFQYQVVCWRMHALHYMWPGGGFYGASDTHKHALIDPCFSSPSYSAAKMHTELSSKPTTFDGRVVNGRLQIRGGNLQNGTQAEETYLSYQILSQISVEGKKPAEAAPDDKLAPVASDSKPASPDNKPCRSLWNDSSGRPICTRAVDDSGTVR